MFAMAWIVRENRAREVLRVSACLGRVLVKPGPMSASIGRRFCGFELVEDSAYYCKKWTTRSSHLDLALPVREKKYNKRGGRIMIQDFRRHYFGKNKRLTKKRCERFFNDDKNFLC
jgi:hypothetical protein